MKYNTFCSCRQACASYNKILLTMKLTIGLLVAVLLQVNAAGFAQKITLSEKNAQLEQVFRKIRKQSGYNFLYNDQMLQEAKKVHIEVVNASITEVLEKCFANQPLTYTITENTIIVKRMAVFQVSTTLPRLAVIPIPITGKVSDSQGVPLPGVSVKLKGTTVGVSTAVNGTFAINLPDDGGTLVFSFIGMKTQEIEVSTRKVIDVVMEDDMAKLSEVVVVGYGSQSRETLTTAISKLDTRVLENVPYSNAASALQGTVTGVRVQSRSGQPGIAPRIIVRGGTSINNPNGASPLYIVDGVIRSDMNHINAEEIESLQVLKDAASTAIYGARGSNGVILITTKSGKSGTARIAYGYDITSSQVAKTWDLLSAREYIYFQRLGLAAAAIKSPTQLNQLTAVTSAGTGNDLTNLTAFTTQYLSAANQHKLNEGWESMPDPLDPTKTIIFKNTDFQDKLFRNGLSHNHTLSASGGTDKARFNAGLGYLTSQGIAIFSDYKRISLNLNGDLKIRDNLQTFARLMYSKSGGEQLTDPQNTLNPFNQAGTITAPTTKYQFEDGSLAPGRNYNDGNFEYNESRKERKNSADGLTMVAGAHWSILPGLSFDPQISLYQETAENRFFQKSYNDPVALVLTRSASGSYSKQLQQQADAVFSYAKSFKSAHNLETKLGFSYFGVDNVALGASGQGAATDNIPTLNASALPLTVNSSESTQRVIGYFSRINYDYKQKYLLNLNARYDGASNLGETHKWGFFPGVSVGWNVHKEDFWRMLPENLIQLKLRGSFGINGNISGLGPYQAQGQYSAATPYNGIAAIQNTILPNQDLQWEQSATFDGGLDLGLFNNRVTFLFDYYRRVTEELLTDLTLAPSSGFTTIRTNLGSLENKGIEFELNARILPAASTLKWDVSFNASKVKTKILKLPFNGAANNRIGGVNVWDAATNTYVWKGGLQEGGRIGDLYDYKRLGIYSTDAEAAGAPVDMTIASTDKKKYGGDVNWADIDGNKLIDARDRVYLGNIFPEWTGGISSSLGYKNLNFSLRMDYTTGHTSLNNTRHRLMAQNSGQGALHADIGRSWQKQGDITDVAKYYWANSQQNFKTNSEFYEKGDFLAIREVTLSYNLPAKLLQKLKVTGMRFNLTGNNLHYFTKYQGLNPDDGGTDFGRYPIPRNIIFGANISL